MKRSQAVTTTLPPAAGAEMRTASRLAQAAAERRRRRKEAADEAERTRVPDRIRPTRQTEARLERDPLLYLHERGTLGAAHLRAALEIRQAFIEAAAGAMVVTQRYDGAPRVSRSFASHDDDTAAAIHRRKRYRRWAGELGAKLPDAVAVAIDVVVEGRSLRQVDAERRWRKGRASDLLVEALELYARLAGWSEARSAEGERERS